MKQHVSVQPLPPLRRERAADTLGTLALAVMLCAMLTLFLLSLFYGARIRPGQYHVIPRSDLFEVNEITSFLAFALMLVALWQIRRIKLTQSVLIGLGVAVLAAHLIVGLVYVFSVEGAPTCDAGILYNTLIRMRTGAMDQSFMLDSSNSYRYYLVSYPFQFGYFSVMDILLRITGAQLLAPVLRGLDVLCIVAAYGAIMLLTQKIFHNEHVTLLTILLLAVCIQPLLYSAACYSQIPSFAFGIWGVYAAVNYLTNRRKRNLLLAAVLLALAVYLKPNAWIMIAAVSIVLVLDAIRAWRWQSLAAVVVLVALALPAPKLIQSYYEAEIGTSFGKGYPMVSWIAMSLQEGDHSTGWYDHSYNVKLKRQFGEDMEGVSKQSMIDLKVGLENITADLNSTIVFLSEKIGTQWLEPTFMCIWATNGGGAPVPSATNAFSQFFYGERFDNMFRFAMRYYLILIYGGSVLSVLFLFRRRSDAALILPLIILGGVLYHVLFEAQSRYALNYLPLFAPVAAYGILTLGSAVTGWLRKKKTDTTEKEA